GGLLEQPEHVEERRFSRARGAGDGHELSWLEVQGHAAQRMRLDEIRTIGFADILKLDHGSPPLQFVSRTSGASLKSATLETTMRWPALRPLRISTALTLIAPSFTGARRA